MLQSGSRRGPPVLLVVAALLSVAAAAVLSFVDLRRPEVGPEVGVGTSPPPTWEGSSTQKTRVMAVGDIGDCNTDADDGLAQAMAERDGMILALGDIVYPDGTLESFQECFAPSWGAMVPRIRPVPGNHDYGTGDASGYFEFFGPAAGDPSRGYYSFDLGSWHLIALNSACDQPTIGCTAGSPQLEWLVQDLSASDAACTLAYWHVPRFSSGEHGGDASVQAFWDALDGFGAEIVLSGHDHNYERLAPMNPGGDRDDNDGIRQFVVGTGGSELRGLGEIHPNNERWATGYTGFLEMILDEGRYQWRFVSAAGEVLDEGSDTCH
jgi:hypothetical protein